MATIIAGHFQLQEEAERACAALQAAGFAEQQLATFFLNPPGQHAATPIGGDHIISPGAKESPEGLAKGQVTGAAVGAAVGAASIPLTGPLGPVLGGLVGAHVGSLYSFSQMKEKGEGEEGSSANQAVQRKSSMMVAVSLPDSEAGRAIDLLRRQGAFQVERAQGHIEDGNWKDFDPLSLPQLV